MDECEGNSLNVETRATRRQSRTRQGGVLGASPPEIKRHPPVFRQLSYRCTSQHGRDQRMDPSDWTMADGWSVQTPGAGCRYPWPAMVTVSIALNVRVERLRLI